MVRPVPYLISRMVFLCSYRKSAERFLLIWGKRSDILDGHVPARKTFNFFSRNIFVVVHLFFGECHVTDRKLMPVITGLCAIYTDCKNYFLSYVFTEVESIFRIAVASVCAVFSHLDCNRIGRIQVNYLDTELERVGSRSIVRTHIQGHNLVVLSNEFLAVSEGIEMIQICRLLSVLVVIDDTQTASLVLIFIITYICKGSHERAAPVDSSAAVAFSSAVIIGVPPVCIHEVCLGEAR